MLEPTPGIYLDDPVSVLDFASLYPNSIRENNFSHETFICTQEEIDENPKKYDWLETILIIKFPMMITSMKLKEKLFIKRKQKQLQLATLLKNLKELFL